MREAAKQELSQNPTGTKFIIEVFNPPPKPKMVSFLKMAIDQINRSYCWVSTPVSHRAALHSVRNQNGFFSNIAWMLDVRFPVARKAVVVKT